MSLGTDHHPSGMADQRAAKVEGRLERPLAAHGSHLEA